MARRRSPHHARPARRPDRREDEPADQGGREVELLLDGLDPASGDATGRLDGAPVHVALALPGERVRAALLPARGDGPRRAALREVLVASPDRVVAPCPHFGPCGGCAWQHVRYAAQLRWKRERVVRLLRDALGRVEPGLVLPTLPTRALPLPSAAPVGERGAHASRAGPGGAAGGAPGAPKKALTDPDAPWGFRNKVHYTLGPGDRGPTLGHYRRGTQRLLPIATCPVHDPRGDAVARAVHAALVRRRIPGVDERGLERGRAPAGARHLLVRTSPATGQALATIVATAERLRGLREVTADVMDGDGRPDGLHLALNDRPGPHILAGGPTRKLHGRERLLEEVAGARFLVSPDAFFQTNVGAAAALVEAVLARIPADGAPVLELFAGCGLFTLPLARRGHRVLAVEESPAAVADAAASRRMSGVDEAAVRTVRERSEVAVRRIADGLLPAPDAPTVLVDPPRDGCAPGLLELIVRRLAPERLVYVSCNPEALAQDAARLAALGWRPVDVQPVDMFPHTPHVEAVATFLPAADGRGRRPGRDGP